MTIDTFRTVLLATLVIMLVFVLYKRLLTLLGTKKKNESYAAVNSWEFSNENKVLKISIHLPAVQEIKLEVFDAQGILICHRAAESKVKGAHFLTEKIIPRTPGKYYYKITTPNHEISQFFEVS